MQQQELHENHITAVLVLH